LENRTAVDYTVVMATVLRLKDMTRREKLAVMEALWEDLSRAPESIKSPAWHKGVLDERRQRIAASKARFKSWETAKAEIRRKVL